MALTGRRVYDEVVEYKKVKSDVGIKAYRDEAVGADDKLLEVKVTESEPAVIEVLQEETDTIIKYYEQVNESIEIVDEVSAEMQEFDVSDITKEHYEALTDKEKVEWLGIAECSVQDAIQRFISKLDSIDVVYRYSDDMLDEFMKLESVMVQMERDNDREGDWCREEMDRKISR